MSPLGPELRLGSQQRQEPWVVGGKVAGLKTKEYKLMLNPKEGKFRACILANRYLSIFLLRNYSNEDNTADRSG